MNASNHREVPAAMAQLRAEIEQHPKNQSGKRRGVPDELKRRAVVLFGRSGMKAGAFAAAISTSDSAFYRWTQQLGRSPKDSAPKSTPRGFKKVSLCAEPAVQPLPGITLEGPGGMRITGLSAEELARLWRALSC
jgi:transposase-like protein